MNIGSFFRGHLKEASYVKKRQTLAEWKGYIRAVTLALLAETLNSVMENLSKNSIHLRTLWCQHLKDFIFET